MIIIQQDHCNQNHLNSYNVREPSPKISLLHRTEKKTIITQA